MFLRIIQAVALCCAIAILTVHTLQAQSIPQDICPGIMPSVLTVGAEGRVSFFNESVRLRNGPGTSNTIILDMEPGTQFTVVDGPVCGAYAWWQLQLADGTVGWAAEGYQGNYFLELLTPENSSSEIRVAEPPANLLDIQDALVGIWQNQDEFAPVSHIGFYADGTVVFVPMEGDTRGRYTLINSNLMQMDLVTRYADRMEFARTVQFSLDEDSLDLDFDFGGRFQRLRAFTEADRRVCGGLLPSRLTVGFGGTTGFESVDGIPLHEQPSETSPLLDTVPPGRRFWVTDGPLCDEEHIWWQIEMKDSGHRGWMTEADQSQYDLEPFPAPSPVPINSVNPLSADCHSSYVIVENSPIASETVEVIFCESAIAGQGSLWIRSHATIAHLVEIIPDAGIENLQPVSGFVWGPDYWFPISSRVTFEPGEQIRIRATRFGATRSELIAALNVHLSLIAELVFIGNTPEPDENELRYVILLLEQIPLLDIDVYTSIITSCDEAIDSGGRLALLDCLLSLAQERSVLENIQTVLSELRIERSLEDLSLALEALSRISELGSNFVQAWKYVFQLTQRRQDIDMITVTYPE